MFETNKNIAVTSSIDIVPISFAVLWTFTAGTEKIKPLDEQLRTLKWSIFILCFKFEYYG